MNCRKTSAFVFTAALVIASGVLRPAPASAQAEVLVEPLVENVAEPAFELVGDLIGDLIGAAADWAEEAAPHILDFGIDVGKTALKNYLVRKAEGLIEESVRDFMKRNESTNSSEETSSSPQATHDMPPPVRKVPPPAESSPSDAIRRLSERLNQPMSPAELKRELEDALRTIDQPARDKNEDLPAVPARQKEGTPAEKTEKAELDRLRRQLDELDRKLSQPARVPEQRLDSDSAGTLGMAALRRSDFSEADRLFRSGIQTDPREVGHRYGLALALLLEGRSKEADCELASAVAFERQHAHPAQWYTVRMEMLPLSQRAWVGVARLDPATGVYPQREFGGLNPPRYRSERRTAYGGYRSAPVQR